MRAPSAWRVPGRGPGTPPIPSLGHDAGDGGGVARGGVAPAGASQSALSRAGNYWPSRLRSAASRRSRVVAESDLRLDPCGASSIFGGQSANGGPWPLRALVASPSRRFQALRYSLRLLVLDTPPPALTGRAHRQSVGMVEPAEGHWPSAHPRLTDPALQNRLEPRPLRQPDP